jgi:hypothetical protein
VSSGAAHAFELRGPYDIINLATLFGLSEQQAKVGFQGGLSKLLTLNVGFGPLIACSVASDVAKWLISRR